MKKFLTTSVILDTLNKLLTLLAIRSRNRNSRLLPPLYISLIPEFGQLRGVTRPQKTHLWFYTSDLSIDVQNESFKHERSPANRERRI